MIKWSGGRFFGIYDTLAHITWFLNYGPIPEGKSIRHLDNDPMNCDIKNLALMDPGEIAAQVAEELPDTYVSKNLFLQSL